MQRGGFPVFSSWPVMFGETGILFSFLSSRLSHQPLPADGERERIWNGPTTPGFLVGPPSRAAPLGYKYFAPSWAWAKRSAILTPEYLSLSV